MGRLAGDTTSYLDLAQRWAAWDWGNAVNGYWPPLLSWIAALPVALGIDPAWAGQLAMMTSALVVMAAVSHLLSVVRAVDRARRLVVWSLVPLLVWLIQREVAPDLLSAGLVLEYLALVSAADLGTDRRRQVAAGLVAGAAFLAKPYAAPVILAHLVLLMVLRREDRGFLRAGLVVAGLLLATIASWSMVLSAKYDRVTVSSSGRLNVGYAIPGSVGSVAGTEGLFPLPYPQASSFEVDPTLLPPPATVERSPSAAVRQVSERVGRNLANAVRAAVVALPLTVAGLVGIGLVGHDRRRGSPRRQVEWVLAAAAIHLAGLVFLFVELRYLLLPLLVLSVPAALALQSSGVVRRTITRVTSEVALVGGATALGIVLLIGLPDGTADIERARALETMIAPGTQVAGAARGSLCWRLGCHYHGAADGTVDLPRLCELGITRFVGREGEPLAIEGLTPLGEVSGLVVYSVDGVVRRPPGQGAGPQRCG